MMLSNHDRHGDVMFREARNVCQDYCLPQCGQLLQSVSSDQYAKLKVETLIHPLMQKHQQLKVFLEGEE